MQVGVPYRYPVHVNLTEKKKKRAPGSPNPADRCFVWQDHDLGDLRAGFSSKERKKKVMEKSTLPCIINAAERMPGILEQHTEPGESAEPLDVLSKRACEYMHSHTGYLVLVH